ncbi:MAG: lysophospholipase [Deltaproteobacteria bacterium]|nr:lysophospholipase [Deltaproteobacteria bacterium]
MTNHSSGNFEGAKGTRLFFQQWLAPKPKARLLFIHGLGEHSDRYHHTAHFFVSAGYSVFHFDLRGHGKSEGQRGFAESLADLLADIDRFITKFGANSDPLFLIGHSFGGQLALNYVTSSYPGIQKLNGIIFSSPNIRVAIDIPLVKVQASRLLSRMIPRLSLANEIPIDFLSHDPEVVKAYNRDPLVQTKITTRLGDLILRNQEMIDSLAQKIRLPSLFLLGSEDRICSPEASKEFFKKIPVEDKTLKIYPGFYHELFNEVGKERVFNDMVQWIEKHL